MPKCGKCHVKTKLNIQLKKHTCSIKTSVIRSVAEQPTDNKSPKKVILEKRESHQFTRGKPKETIVQTVQAIKKQEKQQNQEKQQMRTSVLLMVVPGQISLTKLAEEIVEKVNKCSSK